MFTNYLDANNKKIVYEEVKPFLRAQRIVLCDKPNKNWSHLRKMTPISLD